MIDVKFEDQGQPQLLDRDETEEEDDCFESIDKLISQGTNAGDVKKLYDAGIYTWNGLMMHTKKAMVDQICEAAENLVNTGYMTGSDLLLPRVSSAHSNYSDEAKHVLNRLLFPIARSEPNTFL